ncbi:uncharacterized protein LOC107226321 isoform X3 [Neodiprion lecontei]|uniref:Phosphodiesterase n=1 Tax=Neodiprion lecontei TaxID=441921 RepID=A0ABM3FMP6_NEOLC|nr:uncharacterized protein LOC107226321 isoform X3 [Neodiprion lecontei]
MRDKEWQTTIIRITTVVKKRKNKGRKGEPRRGDRETTKIKPNKSKVASTPRREASGHRGGIRGTRRRVNGGGSLSSRGSATGLQCGLCAVVAGLFRRAMCIAGSRRGSGESCYQELPYEGPIVPQIITAIPQAPLRVKSASGSLRVQSPKEPRERRTSATTVDNTTQNAALVRVSDDAVAPALSSGTSPSPSPSPSPAVPVTHRGSTTNTFRRLSDVDKLLLEAMDTSRDRTRHTGRFLTMHKRRRKRLTTRTLNQDPGILDDIFHGQVQCLLQKSGNWRFNAFTLETVTGGRSLPVLCVHLFHWYGLLEHFQLDVVRVWKLFNLIEEGYHSTNPYHNSIHATDVTQAMHCFLQEEKIRKHLSHLEIMASLIGAVTHDLDHPGVNQPFLVATSNHLAALYENTSVLENHHWRSAIGCLLESGVSEQLEPELRPELERHISSLILATDITRQQEFLTRFKRYLDQNLLDMSRSEDRHFILQIALKCADISNPCRPWDISRKWSHKVCEEFFRQGDYERKLNLPVTPLCDRHTISIPKIQAGFFKFVVTPLYEEWHRFLGTALSVNLMDYLKGNQTRWEALIQQEAAEETKTEISELEDIDNALSSEDEDLAEDSGSIDLLLPDASSSRRPSLPGKVDTERVGRRHSVPLSVPKLLPISRTIIRRESLPTEQKKLKTPLVKLEDQTMLGRSSLSLLSSKSSLHSSAARSSERPVSAENLLPEPSIASITNSKEASRLSTVLQPDQKLSSQTKQLTRQQTFPPLQPYVRMRYMSTTAEMSQCSEALIEADSLSSSTPSPTKDRSYTDGQCSTPLESPVPCNSKDSSRRSSATFNVARIQKRESNSSEASIKRRGSAMPDLMRKLDTNTLSPECARRHSMQLVDSLLSIKKTSQKSSTLTLDVCDRRKSVETESESADLPHPEGTIITLEVKSGPNICKTYSHNERSSPETGNTTDLAVGVDSVVVESCYSDTKLLCDSTRRFSIPVIDLTKNDSQINRRFSAVPISSDSAHRAFFVGTPPDSPPRVLSGSSDSGSEPRRSVSDSTNDSVAIGNKRDSETGKDKGAKVLKLSVEPEMKENVDPRCGDDGRTLSTSRRSNQGLARRRSSAPVGLLSKLDDVSMLALAPRGDRYSRRGSVPTDMTRHQSEEADCPNNNNASTHVIEAPLPISGMPSLRRGSVPADISELRREMYNRNSVNGKSRNRKKVLRRRSSGGPEMFAGGMDVAESAAWIRWKRDIGRKESIPEPATKRRGSLPIDMVAISHAAGSVPMPRKSSLWRL